MSDQELTRSEVIVKGALAAGAVYGLGLIGPYAHNALAIAGENDLDSLQYLLLFEHLQVQLYSRGNRYMGDATGDRRLDPANGLGQLVKRLADEEQQHADTLTAAIKGLGGKPRENHVYSFSWNDTSGFVQLAEALEQATVSAYNGVIPSIKSKEILETLGSIVQVEGRHLAAVRLQLKAEPAPDAFEEAASIYEGLGSVEKFVGPSIYKNVN